MEEEKEVQHEFCNRCKCWRLPSQFLNNKKRRLKNCQVCNKLQRGRRIKCIYDGCQTRPGFNYEGEIKPLYCATHRLDGIIDFKHKYCIFDGCKTHPVYNNNGETKGLYCATHKLDEMINVVDKTCNNKLYYYISNNIQPVLTIPDGLYSVTLLNIEVQRLFSLLAITPNPIQITGNTATGKSILTLAQNYQVDFTI